MNSFTLRIPNFVDTSRKPEKEYFETTEELLNLPTVKRATEDPGFSHLAIENNMLMEIGDDGYFWWVLGYIEDPSSVNLPRWDGSKYKAQMSDGTIVKLSRQDVYSCCGNIITLKDGRTATYLRSR
jgi:hypothetical protein